MNESEKTMIGRMAELLPKLTEEDKLMLEGFLQGLAFNCEKREAERKTA